MIITCTECKKRFEVPDNAIPAEGRIVQCSSCSNEWKQFPIKKPEIVKKTTVFSAKKTAQPIKKKTERYICTFLLCKFFRICFRIFS